MGLTPAGTMQRILNRNLIRLRDEFMRARKEYQAPIGVTSLSRLVANSGLFMSQLDEATTTYTVRRYDETVERFAYNWPKNAKWPPDIPGGPKQK